MKTEEDIRNRIQTLNRRLLSDIDNPKLDQRFLQFMADERAILKWVLEE